MHLRVHDMDDQGTRDSGTQVGATLILGLGRYTPLPTFLWYTFCVPISPEAERPIDT